MKNKLLFTTLLFSVCIVGFAIVGGIRNYTAVPHWDMWDGTLLFYSNIENGNYYDWWAQHNEHRIVLARLLFWIDYRFFGGLNVFLIIANYIIVGFSAFVFWLILREVTEEKTVSSREAIFSLLMTSWLFLWAQENNLTVGFQSQFILAQLLPLCSLFWLAKSVTTGGRRDFIIACIFGVLSAGAMANGVLALPLMFIYALLLKQGIARTSVLLLLAACTNTLYFYNYHSPTGHGHLFSSLLENPLGFFHFILLYLGSPFYFLLAQGSMGKVAAVIMGGLLIIGSAWLALKQLSNLKRSPIIFALLFFILYVGGSAFGTAGGRLIFGLDMALASRYTTPSIMAFSALFIALYVGTLNSFKGAKNKALVALVIAVCVLMLASQIKALKPMNNQLSERAVAALALDMDIKDDQFIGSVYPASASENALNIARAAVQGHYSIFGVYPYSDLKRQVGAPFGPLSPTKCIGNLDFIEPIESVTDYVRVNGWIYSATTEKIPTLVRILNKSGQIAGFALTGTPRPDVADVISSKARFSGFRGYLRSDATGAQIDAEGDNPACNLRINAPPKIFDITKLAPLSLSFNLTTLRNSSVVANIGWTGTDFQHTYLAQMTILGSLIDSDANTGSLILKMKRGDKLLYRSGPTGGRQMVEVLLVPQLVAKLPVALDWVQLDFSGSLLPDTFELKLSDNGNGWGEWSAVAVRTEGIKNE
ncbi:hypothetical protein HUU62_24390 [Rhodoferax sp. 4810]|nr:hypothetical protein [Rhodoferax jenense]